MTLSFLFWNVRGNAPDIDERKPRILEALGNLATTRSLDVILLAECRIEPTEILSYLASADEQAFSLQSEQKDKVQVFSKFARGRWTLAYRDSSSGNRLSIHRLRFPDRSSLLLALLHFPSKQHLSEAVGAFNTMRLFAEQIRQTEEETACERTILVGDMNWNPYESPLISRSSLNSRMTKRLALAAKEPAFYHPMWGFLGDWHQEPGGTYYYADWNDQRNPFWHVLDQVLVRPSLCDNLGEVEIVTGDGTRSFLARRSGKIAKDFSDHLPLYFELRCPGETDDTDS